MTLEENTQITPFGKIIASDGGLTQSHLLHHQVAIIFCSVVTIALSLFFLFVFFLFLVNVFWGNAGMELMIPLVFVGFGTGLCILACILSIHQLSVEKKTNITVCESGIIGDSEHNILLTLFWLESVRLPYEVITAVDSYEGSALGEFFHGKSITIHSSYRQYRFFVKKPSEIQQAIFEQRYRLQQQRQSQ